MSEPSPLEQLIEATIGEGQCDSHGTFSVSFRETLAKLGTHASYHSDQWALTFVQALIALQCVTVYVIHKGAEVWIVGHQPGKPFRASQLDELSPHLLLGRALGAEGLMARALGSLLSSEVQSLLLASWTDPLEQPEVTVLLASGDGKKPAIKPMLPGREASLALYVRFVKHNPELPRLLPYALQYCPIPVHLLEHGWLLTSNTDVRTAHWLNQSPTCAAYPAQHLVQITGLLLADIYRNGSEPALLLKPPGGNNVTYFAAWSDNQEFPWLNPPGWMDGICSQARYFPTLHGPVTRLTYTTQKAMGNSVMNEKGSRTITLDTTLGDFVLMIEQNLEPDRVVPIRQGITLAGLTGALGIPGVVVVAPSAGLEVDLGGLTLIHNQALKEWLQGLRLRVKEALLEVLQNPPQAGPSPISLGKTMLATGLTAFALACLDGFQGSDFVFFTHGGAFGGMAMYGFLKFVRRHAPPEWFVGQREKLLGQLRERLQATEAAISAAQL